MKSTAIVAERLPDGSVRVSCRVEGRAVCATAVNPAYLQTAMERVIREACSAHMFPDGRLDRTYVSLNPLAAATLAAPKPESLVDTTLVLLERLERAARKANARFDDKSVNLARDPAFVGACHVIQTIAAVIGARAVVDHLKDQEIPLPPYHLV